MTDLAPNRITDKFTNVVSKAVKKAGDSTGVVEWDVFMAAVMMQGPNGQPSPQPVGVVIMQVANPVLGEQPIGASATFSPLVSVEEIAEVCDQMLHNLRQQRSLMLQQAKEGAAEADALGKRLVNPDGSPVSASMREEALPPLTASPVRPRSS